jgi:preprotein translocase subunit SecY
MTQGGSAAQPPKRGSAIGGPEELLKVLNSPGLRERILFTLAMIAIYRIGVHIPLPGVDPGAMAKHPELAQNLLGMIDLFTGGALGKLSIFSMGIGPYITASIIMQLMGVVVPKLEELQKHSGEQGRRQLQQYTRYATVVLAGFQSFMLAKLLLQIQSPPVVTVPPEMAPLFLFTATVILTASALFIMWLGETITERGVGNGASLLIFLGIASRLPVNIKNTYEAVQAGTTAIAGVAILVAVFLALTALIVCLQQGVRKIMVLGARRNVGAKVMSVPDDYLYLPVNPSGVMSIIFASSLLMFPSTVMSFAGKGGGDPMQGLHQWLSGLPGVGPSWAALAAQPWAQKTGDFLMTEFARLFSYQTWEHSLLYFGMIMFFAFFYASIVLPIKDMAENLRRSGRAIQGVKPGRPTAEFLEKTLNRLIFIGATAIGIVAILPIHVEQATGVQTLQGLGSTSLIILVGVAIDTQRQIMTHAMAAKTHARGLFRSKDDKGKETK